MKTISLKVPEAMLRKLERTARQRGQNKSEVMRLALEKFLNAERGARRPMSALELAGDLVGCCEGPGDLATNPKYMEGFGE